MTDLIESILRSSRQGDTAMSTDALLQQVRVSSQHHASGPGAMEQALAIGDPRLVATLVQSPKLEPRTRATLATTGVRMLLQDPLAKPNCAMMLSSLLYAGGDAQTMIGYVPACARLGETLGRIEYNEDQLRLKNPKAQAETGGGQALRACWKAMQDAGVDLNEAQARRDIAKRVPISLSGWRVARAEKPTTAKPPAY